MASKLCHNLVLCTYTYNIQTWPSTYYGTCETIIKVEFLRLSSCSIQKQTCRMKDEIKRNVAETKGKSAQNVIFSSNSTDCLLTDLTGLAKFLSCCFWSIKFLRDVTFRLLLAWYVRSLKAKLCLWCFLAVFRTEQQ